MKRHQIISLLICALCGAFILSGCDSKNVKLAREEYANHNYDQVVELLQNESLKDDVVPIYRNAQAYVAFSNEDYETVVSLLENEELDDDLLKSYLLESKIITAFNSDNYQYVLDLCAQDPETDVKYAELKRLSEINLAYIGKDYNKVLSLIIESDLSEKNLSDMFYASSSYIAYQTEDYVGAVDALFKTTDPQAHDIYKDASEHAIDIYINNHETDSILNLIESDSGLCDCVFDRLTSEEYRYDYPNWCLIDSIISGTSNGELKLKLYEYLNSDYQYKVFSFILGDWTWGDEDSTLIVHIGFVSEDKETLTGIVTSVEGKNEFKHVVGEEFWYKFEADSPTSILSKQLGRRRDGSIVENDAIWRIDFQSDSIQITTSTSAVAIVVTPSRTWTRVPLPEEIEQANSNA